MVLRVLVCSRHHLICEEGSFVFSGNLRRSGAEAGSEGKIPHALAQKEQAPCRERLASLSSIIIVVRVLRRVSGEVGSVSLRDVQVSI
jgi:hypothetical protein